MGAALRRAMLPLAVTSVAAAGCGDRNPTSHEQVRAAVDTLIASCVRDEPARAMDVLTEPLRATFTRAGSTAQACARFLGIGRRRAGEAALMRSLRGTSITAVELHGGLAKVRLQTPGGRSELELGYTEGRWLLEGPGRAV